MGPDIIGQLSDISKRNKKSKAENRDMKAVIEKVR